MGLLLLRVIVGLLFVGHGSQKLFGWFGGHGVEGTAGFFDQLDYPRPRKMAWLGGATEAGAGVLLTLGFLTPLAAAGIIGMMVNAIFTVHVDNGLWNSQGGYEYNLVLATAAAAFAFSGPGALALDNAIGLNLAGPGWGIAAIVVGLGTAGIALGSRQPEPAGEPRADRAEAEEEADERQVA